MLAFNRLVAESFTKTEKIVSQKIATGAGTSSRCRCAVTARTTTTFVTFQSRLCRGESGDGFAHSVVHRSSASLGASQEDSGISWLQRRARLEQAYRNEAVGESLVAAVLLEYKHEDSEAIACHIKQRFPNVPLILLSAYFEMPERVLWVVDEYVMKSDMQERLVPIIERAHKVSLCPGEPHRRRGQKHSHVGVEPDLPCVIAVAPCAVDNGQLNLMDPDNGR